MRLDGPVGITVLSILSIFLVLTTGGLNSPLFPLLYFVAFAIGFLLRPYMVFVFVIAVALFLLSNILKGDVLGNLIKVWLLTFIAPLAFFLARLQKKQEKEDEKVEAIKERAEDSADTISKDVEEIIKGEKGIQTESTKRLNEILEETEGLREESKEK